MKSFRQEITEQIERIPKGRIFTAKDLTFDVSKTANLNVLLAELVKKGQDCRGPESENVKGKEETEVRFGVKMPHIVFNKA